MTRHHRPGPRATDHALDNPGGQPADGRVAERPLFESSLLRGSAELTAINTAVLSVAAVGIASALVPGVERAVGLLVAAAAGTAALAVAVRLVARWRRERREDRADAQAAAAFRAAIDQPNPPSVVDRVGPARAYRSIR